MDPTLRWIEEQVRRQAGHRGGEPRALKAGYAFGETTEIFHTHYRVKPAHLPPGTYRNITGNEATALGFVAAAKLAKRDLFYGSYPITPASDILHQLSGYKNFGVKTFQAEDEIAAIGSAIGASYGGAMGMTASSGPGHRAQDRGHGPGRHGRAAARGRRRPARRPQHRHAHQDRAGGPAPGHVRAQQRLAHPDRRAGHARRVLRLRHRGVAHRAQVHDPGGLPVRRVPGHRRGAVEDPGPRGPAEHRRRQLDGQGDLPPVRPRPRDAGPPLGRARHARPGAPHRRPREGRHHGQRQLRPGEPPPDADAAGAEGGRHRRRHPGSPGLRPGARRAADPRLGLHLRRDPQRRRAPPGRGPQRLARPPAPPQPVPAQHRGRAHQLQARADPRGQPGPAAHAHPRALPDRRRGPQPGARQALPHLRDRRGGATDPHREGERTDDRRAANR